MDDQIGTDLLGDEEDHDALLDLDLAPGKKGSKKRDGSKQRKAPNAPKRFKSSYICFFMAKQQEIKDELGEHATVTAISKRTAEVWKQITSEERKHWDGVASKDKARYMVEKAQYTGPWQVPWKRARKDPSAPKRPMSAFLYFSQGQRPIVREQNPNLKNTEVSRILGEMWRNLSAEERSPHVEKEKAERDIYKIKIAQWRSENELKQESLRKLQAEQAEIASTTVGPEMTSTQLYADTYAAMQQPGMYSFQNFQPQVPPGYQYPTNGKQPVILGPSGTPHYANPSSAVSTQGLPPTTFDESSNSQKFEYPDRAGI